MTSPQSAFGDYQLEIYGAGLRGVIPEFPMAFAELEARAAQALSPSVLSYVAGGAGSEHTQRANAAAFHQWGLIPRMFVGASKRDLTVELFGLTLPSPLLMAPIGVIGLCAQDGRGDRSLARHRRFHRRECRRHRGRVRSRRRTTDEAGDVGPARAGRSR